MESVPLEIDQFPQTGRRIYAHSKPYLNSQNANNVAYNVYMLDLKIGDFVTSDNGTNSSDYGLKYGQIVGSYSEIGVPCHQKIKSNAIGYIIKTIALKSGNPDYYSSQRNWSQHSLAFGLNFWHKTKVTLGSKPPALNEVFNAVKDLVKGV